MVQWQDMRFGFVWPRFDSECPDHSRHSENNKGIMPDIREQGRTSSVWPKGRFKQYLAARAELSGEEAYTNQFGGPWDKVKKAIIAGIPKADQEQLSQAIGEENAVFIAKGLEVAGWLLACSHSPSGHEVVRRFGKWLGDRQAIAYMGFAQEIVSAKNNHRPDNLSSQEKDEGSWPETLAACQYLGNRLNQLSVEDLSEEIKNLAQQVLRLVSDKWLGVLNDEPMQTNQSKLTEALESFQVMMVGKQEIPENLFKAEALLAQQKSYFIWLPRDQQGNFASTFLWLDKHSIPINFWSLVFLRRAEGKEDFLTLPENKEELIALITAFTGYAGSSHVLNYNLNIMQTTVATPITTQQANVAQAMMDSSEKSAVFEQINRLGGRAYQFLQGPDSQ